tara:strand:- start:58 stop:417 length:360 start_codon:yes stop_codon:yes gene_type:complete
MSLTFGRTKKIVSKKDFKSLYNKCYKHHGKHVYICYLQTSGPQAKIGITIKKKWGKAHERNRFKRISREAFRRTYSLFPVGMHINIHPKFGFLKLRSHDLETELKTLIHAFRNSEPKPT